MGTFLSFLFRTEEPANSNDCVSCCRIAFADTASRWDADRGRNDCHRVSDTVLLDEWYVMPYVREVTDVVEFAQDW
jgi:hypothetical protein